jgi:hypothetical protein
VGAACNILPVLVGRGDLRGTVSVVKWSEFLATDPKVPGLIHGATRFSEK